jgi:DNA-binding LacI/PurR family transcriptional regulator
MPFRKSASRPVNMIEVARLAGVSTATVGRVVHQRGYVSEAARQRVEQAIQQTGFRLNLVAQSLRCQRSKTIGHLINSLIPNPFFAGVEAGVEEAASEKGYNVLIWNFMADPQRERAGVEAFIRRQIDAIIFTTPFDIHNVQLAQQAGIEIVQVERPTSLPSHCVLVDNYVGAVAAMRHLIDLGHRRIGFIGNTCPDELSGQKINNNVDRQRYQGYLDELAFHGIQPEAAWSCLNANPYSLVDGERAALSLLQMQPAVTAILSSCDILAAGALQAIYRLGLRVPDDISLIGFDNTYAPFLTPPLTTVAVPLIEVGKAAARLAIRALETETGADAPSSFQQETVSTRLVVRQSTGLAR